MFDFAHLVPSGFFVAVEVLPPTSAESMLSSVGHLAGGVDGADICKMSLVYSRPCSSKARHQVEPIDEGSVDHQVRMRRPVKRGWMPWSSPH